MKQGLNPVQSGNKNSRRRGFTLVELLVVIAIIAVLIGLLGAAVQMARVRVVEVRTRADLTQLHNAVESRKTKWQVPYVPSRIVLREDMLYGTHTNPAIRALELQSRTELRRIWPRLQSTPIDWNQDGIILPGDAGAYILEGDQCLVFFLGGAQQGGACIGFSSNKSNPMAPGGNREPPEFDFPTSRLTLLPHPASGNAPFLSFIDHHDERPYLYFSSRNGNDYTADCPSSNQWVEGGVSQVVPYHETSVAKFHSRDSFQIIAAGRDKWFGVPNAGSAAVGYWDARSAQPYVNAGATDTWHRNGQDDLTNFHALKMGSGQ